MADDGGVLHLILHRRESLEVLSLVHSYSLEKSAIKISSFECRHPKSLLLNRAGR